jgi:hypothetical protein
MITHIATRPLTAHKQESRRTPDNTPAWKRDPLHPKYQVRIATLEGEVTLSIDVDAIIQQMGTRAIKSKTHRCVEANGAVVVTAKIKSSAFSDWSEWKP